MSSIFTQIIQGEIPCHKIYESDTAFAFLDIRPIREGHTLLVPKKEVDVFFELDDDTLSDLTLTAKRISQAIQDTVHCQRVGMMVAGLEVPHAHMHLIPIQRSEDLNFALASHASDETLAAIAEAIRANLS